MKTPLSKDVIALRPFLFESMHRAQQRLGNGPNGRSDADVIVYLVHQLMNAADPSFLSPRHHEALFGCPTDLQLYFDAHPNMPEIGRAKIYALNANARVITIVIFRQGSLLRPNASRFHPHTHLHHAQIFYQFAGDLFEHRSHRSPTNATLADVHFKLAATFEWYIKLLDHLRSDYLHLIEQFSAGTMFHLAAEAQQQFDRTQDRQVMDAVLDAMLDHRREPNQENLLRLQQAKQTAQQRGLFY